MAETLFISDLHISEARPGTLQLLLQFLAGRARQAEALYILGDLFDAWIGDDFENPAIARIKAGLHELAAGGGRIHFMHGNRDFLLGEAFCAQCGIELLPDPWVVELYGTRTVLTHGDLLCTDDLSYQAYRAYVRKPEVIRDFLSKPIEQRISVAAELRARSGEANSMKAEDILDVNQAAVEGMLRTQGVNRMIHGHTHRSKLHLIPLDGIEAQRYVLPEWHEEHAGMLRVSGSDWKFEAFPAA